MATKYRKKFAAIARHISDYELQKEKPEELSFSESDLYELEIGGNAAVPKNRRFLGFFTLNGIEYVFNKFGLIKELKKRGFKNIVFNMNTKDPYRHGFSFYYDRIDPEHLLGEIICRIQTIKLNLPESSEYHKKPIRTVRIEWLSLQNPKKDFDKKRPQLPGQAHPGLGLGFQVFELLVLMAKRLNCDAMLNIPEHFHNAALYSREFFYVNPVHEGHLQAIFRDISSKFPLAHVSFAFDNGCVINAVTNEPFPWFIGEQLTPLNKKLMAYFSTETYKIARQKALGSMQLKLKEQCLEKNIEAKKKNGFRLW